MGTIIQYEEPVRPQLLVHGELLSCHSQVVLGSPGNGCNGVGICRMYMMTYYSLSLHCPTIKAQLLQTDRGRLRICFSKAALESKYLNRHFRRHLFQVPEGFELPGWTRRRLELPQRRIEPGIYPVWETEEAYTVDF